MITFNSVYVKFSGIPNFVLIKLIKLWQPFGMTLFGNRVGSKSYSVTFRKVLL